MFGYLRPEINDVEVQRVKYSEEFLDIEHNWLVERKKNVIDRLNARDIEEISAAIELMERNHSKYTFITNGISFISYMRGRVNARVHKLMVELYAYGVMIAINRSRYLNVNGFQEFNIDVK